MHTATNPRRSVVDPFERPLPKNTEAERSILGAILLDNNTITIALEKLAPEDFFHDHHRKLYQQMTAMQLAGTPIDLVTLTETLQNTGQLEAAGGAAYISKLMDGVPHVTNVEHYVSIVKQCETLRKWIFATDYLQQRAFAAEDPSIILDRANDIFSSIAARETTPGEDWRARFHTVDELPDGDVEMLIDGFLPVGVSAIGALSGLGKTWFALAMGRALSGGRKFLGIWDVAGPVNVLYLCPEMQARAFKRRCKRFGIAGDRFRCMTISDGQPLDLADPILTAAIRELKPVVFLDTAIRFSNGEDESSAGDHANGPAKAIFSLLHFGAKGVICLHHRAKETARSEELTLENTLRGSGDVGAICDAVYGLQHDRGDGSAAYLKESKRLVRLCVRCVKARDFHSPADFRIQLEPYLDELQDMAVVADEHEAEQESEVQRLSRAIAENPKATKVELQAITRIGRNRIEKLAAQDGWRYTPTAGWENS